MTRLRDKYRQTGILLTGFIFSLCGAPLASAEWVWSPQTGWIGPGGAVKDNPEDQLTFAQAFFENKEYDRARREFQKLLKAYQAAKQAPEAQYYLGRCAEESGDYYKAFLEYRKTIQTYPSTQRFDEILEREYRIGNAFLEGKKRKLFGKVALIPARDKAVEVFQAMVDDGPFGEYGQLAQYNLGLAHMALQDYEFAVNAFEQLILRYAESPLVDDARFQIALASLKGTFKSGYDQSPTDTAIREMEVFVESYPESDLANEAKTRLTELYERRAAHEFEVGQFYEHRRHPLSAKLYYETIVERYTHTSWATQAMARLDVLNPSP